MKSFKVALCFLFLSSNSFAAEETALETITLNNHVPAAYAHIATKNQGRDVFGVGLSGIVGYPQPDRRTCGASNIATLVNWEAKKAGGRLSLLNVRNIYSRVNTNDSNGLIAPELKSGIISEIDRYRYKRGQHINTGTWINYEVMEDGRKDLDDAMTAVVNYMKVNYSPVIIYGNVDRGLLFGGAGGHYFTIYAIDNCNCDGIKDGVKLMDSSYRSAAYDPVTSLIGQLSIPYDMFLSQNELEDNWKKTGSANIFARRHFFVANSHPGR